MRLPPPPPLDLPCLALLLLPLPVVAAGVSVVLLVLDRMVTPRGGRASVSGPRPGNVSATPVQGCAVVAVEPVRSVSRTCLGLSHRNPSAQVQTQRPTAPFRLNGRRCTNRPIEEGRRAGSQPRTDLGAFLAIPAPHVAASGVYGDEWRERVAGFSNPRTRRSRYPSPVRAKRCGQGWSPTATAQPKNVS